MPKPFDEDTAPVEAVTYEEPRQPLSRREKQRIISKLKSIDDEMLTKALIEASLNRCKFPLPLEEKLTPFYKACDIHQSNSKVVKLTKKVMRIYIESDGIIEFNELLNSNFKEELWPTDLLYFLKRNLDIKIKNDPTVQVAIQNGKIYWRIMKDDKEVFNRHPEFDFDEADTWYMTWEQFRLFKDSGKRKGTVAITKERFRDYFKDKYHEQAESVWDELKEKGILNEHHRLTDAWRASSNTIIKLKSIDVESITTKDVMKCINALTEKNKKIDKDRFVEYWLDQYKSRAGLIWEKLKKIGYIGKNNIVNTQKIPPLDTFLVNLNLSYSDIAASIYAVCNNKDYSETLHEDLPNNYVIFREERSVKKWDGTDNSIKNVAPKGDMSSTKLWDVGVYRDLNAHRNTVFEVSDNGAKLNYDHVPSTDALRKRTKELLAEYDTKIDTCKKSIEKLEQQKIDRLAELSKEKQCKRLTKSEIQTLSKNDEIEKITNKINILNKKLKILNDTQAALEKESKGHGPYWWTIAIPEKLHHQGETFMQASSDQNQKKADNFLRDATAYFDILETRAEEFSLSVDDVIKAAGAFRYLFKQNLKSAETVDGRYTTGITPHHFFSKPKENKSVDGFFRERIQKLIEKREGIQSTTANTQPSSQLSGG